MLWRQDTSAGGDLETKLMRRCMPGRDRHSAQAKRIRSRRVDAAVRRATASKARAPDDLAARFGEWRAAAVGIRERIDARADLLLELQPRAEHLVARVR